ncbi:MAG: hypothetical protein E7488_05400 [Ruminococcaceae bacterium]|nr:hypothetical protein [Oscillospiraceae bacterium]
MIYPILLSAFSSLSTGIGGVIVALFRKISDRTMSFFQGFAAGVMITVSLIEMMPRCYENMLGYMDAMSAAAVMALISTVGWVTGRGISAAADYIYRDKADYTQAVHISLVTTAVMVLHNLPEGMLTIFSGLEDTRFGLEIAIAVALHNIPEGIVVASGVLYLTSSRAKAVGHSFFAGISEFIGGLAAVVLFGGMANELFTGAVLAAVGGIMVQTSLCELLPASLKLSGKLHTITGAAAGAVIIYVSLYAI